MVVLPALCEESCIWWRSRAWRVGQLREREHTPVHPLHARSYERLVFLALTHPETHTNPQINAIWHTCTPVMPLCRHVLDSMSHAHLLVPSTIALTCLCVLLHSSHSPHSPHSASSMSSSSWEVLLCMQPTRRPCVTSNRSSTYSAA